MDADAMAADGALFAALEPDQQAELMTRPCVPLSEIGRSWAT